MRYRRVCRNEVITGSTIARTTTKATAPTCARAYNNLARFGFRPYGYLTTEWNDACITNLSDI